MGSCFPHAVLQNAKVAIFVRLIDSHKDPNFVFLRLKKNSRALKGSLDHHLVDHRDTHVSFVTVNKAIAELARHLDKKGQRKCITTHKNLKCKATCTSTGVVA